MQGQYPPPHQWYPWDVPSEPHCTEDHAPSASRPHPGYPASIPPAPKPRTCSSHPAQQSPCWLVGRAHRNAALAPWSLIWGQRRRSRTSIGTRQWVSGCHQGYHLCRLLEPLHGKTGQSFALHCQDLLLVHLVGSAIIKNCLFTSMITMLDTSWKDVAYVTVTEF